MHRTILGEKTNVLNWVYHLIYNPQSMDNSVLITTAEKAHKFMQGSPSTETFPPRLKWSWRSSLNLIRNAISDVGVSLRAPIGLAPFRLFWSVIDRSGCFALAIVDKPPQLLAPFPDLIYSVDKPAEFIDDGHKRCKLSLSSEKQHHNNSA